MTAIEDETTTTTRPGNGRPFTAAVPEPGSLVLLSLGAAVLIRRRGL